MGLVCAANRRMSEDQRGFTLLEVLIAAALLIVVLTAALSLGDTGSRIANRDFARAHAIDETQSGVSRMDTDLRLATQVISPTSGGATNSVEFLANIRSASTGTRTLRRVRYQCDVPSPSNPALRSCFRYESDPSTSPGGAGTIVIDSLVNGTTANPVFTPSGSPIKYFSIHVAVSAAGKQKDGYSRAVTLDHGVYLRNVDGAF